MNAHAPIFNPEAEQAILGAFLHSTANLDRVAHLVRKEHFADPVHAEIFRVVESRYRNGHVCDAVAVAVHMQDHEGLKQLGGKEYIVKLNLAAPPTALVDGYVDLLRELKAKRDIADAIAEAQTGLSDSDVPAQEVAGRLEAALMGREEGNKPPLVSMRSAALNAAQEAAEARDRDGFAGASTGIYGLDAMMGGLFPGDLVIIGGRPSMGKTAVALSIALGQARAGGGVAIASLEMTASSLATRAASEASAQSGHGVAYSDIRKGVATEAQVDTFINSAQQVADLPMMIIPPYVRDIGALYSAAKRAKSMFDGRGVGLKALVVDYLQLIRSSKQSRIDQISEISMALKGLAMQLEVPVIALSQLSRAVESREDKRPVMSDLRESGQIEQDADAILFCYRDEYYAIREEPKIGDRDEKHDEWVTRMDACRNRLEIIVAKQRMGEVGTVNVGFNPAFNLVWDAEARR